MLECSGAQGGVVGHGKAWRGMVGMVHIVGCGGVWWDMVGHDGAQRGAVGHRGA